MAKLTKVITDLITPEVYTGKPKTTLYEGTLTAGNNKIQLEKAILENATIMLFLSGVFQDEGDAYNIDSNDRSIINLTSSLDEDVKYTVIVGDLLIAGNVGTIASSDIYEGNSAPSSASGKPGDFYIQN